MIILYLIKLIIYSFICLLLREEETNSFLRQTPNRGVVNWDNGAVLGGRRQESTLEYNFLRPPYDILQSVL